MPRKEEKRLGASSTESNGIVNLLDDLIKQIKEDLSLVAAIRGRVEEENNWHGFGFETLVRDVLGPRFVDSMKQARSRINNGKDNKDRSNYKNLLHLYEQAQQKYFGHEKLPKIQSISDDVLRETKKLGIDWESEMKKFTDHLRFKSTKL